jgi:hypothetical protein
MSLTKVSYSMIQGAVANALDFGAGTTKTPTENATAIQAALNSGADAVYIPSGAYQVNATLNVPARVTLFGENIFDTNIELTTDVVGIIALNLTALRDFRLSKSGAHTKDGIQLGSVAAAGTCFVERVYVDGMGRDGIQVINGNCGSIADVVSVNNGRDGINFTIDTPDNNAWKLEGTVSVRSNGRDGIHYASGSSVTDPNAPKSQSANLIVSEQNVRYGLYSGTRSNMFVVYGELNGTQDIYLDTYAYGNDVVIVEGGVTDVGSGNLISSHNIDASYTRSFFSRVNFSGNSGAGWRVGNNDGTIGLMDFKKIGAQDFAFSAGGAVIDQVIRFLNDSSGNVLNSRFGGFVAPNVDDDYSCGTADLRWTVVYATTPTINTSDANTKQQVRNLTETEKVVANKCKSLIRAFKFNDAVAKKGDGARIHFGVIAQDIKAAFQSEGLDANNYGLFCYDEWNEEPEIVDKETGAIIQHYRPAGSRYGIRYEELLAFIIAAM